ncbi:hypothetical protein KAJ27_06540 [bacterium]|nr:hypothetical protein [bacterium]
MKPKKPGFYIMMYLLLVLIFLCLFVSGGLVISMDRLLSYKYAPHKLKIGISLMIMGFAVLIGSVKFMLWGMREMAGNLDGFFKNLGLKSESYAADGRHYHGEIDQRKVDIYCKPVKNRQYFGDVRTINYIGHSLDIHISGDFKTRSSIGKIPANDNTSGKLKTFLRKYLKEKYVEKYGGEIFEYQDYDIYALDPDWILKLIKDNKIFDLLVKIFDEETKCIRQHINVTPDSIHFSALTNLRYIKAEIIDFLVCSITQIAKNGENLRNQEEFTS